VNKSLFLQVLEEAYQLKHKDKITHAKPPELLKKDFDFSLDEESLVDEDQKKKLISQIIDESVNTQSPRFLNQLYGGTSDVTWLGELITSILNTSMATYEISPLFTLMEKEIISTINRELSFTDCDGIMVPGGSYANMYGIHCARHLKDKEIKSKGLYSKKPLVAFVSKAAHYSTEKAMNLLGLGVENLISVETDANHKMSVDALRSKIKSSIEKGFEPFCVVSTAGTTVWGSFDPISEIQMVADEFKLWHHIDAAWGGLALWSKEKKSSYFEGVSKVDSITLDFHKLMSSSLTKAIFICSKPSVFYSASSGGGSEYIFHNDNDEENFDTGVHALQCGRKVDALSLWLQWKFGGTQQFSNKFSELHDLKDYTVSLLEKNPKDFSLLHKPHFMNICFHVMPKDGSKPDYSFNQKLREKVMSRGKFMVNFSKDSENGTYFRLVLNHWGLNKSTIEEFFRELLTAREEV
jgi:glutamate/tyrosine decarboxylase-like PLP-dependent enzyme